MLTMDHQLDDLTKLFLQFPGIGERQARRFAHFIIGQPKQYVDRLAAGLSRARDQAHICARCFRIFEGLSAECSICSDESRNQDMLLVLEKSQDIESFHQTDYRGLFFVFGGLVPIVHKKIIDEVRMKELKKRVTDEESAGKTLEIILAFPLTPNGEHTESVIREALETLLAKSKIVRLGRGLSIGTELEYADPLSLNASLKKRE